jgi:hypothetical protein
MWDLSFTVEPEHLLVGSAPATLDISVTCTDITQRGARMSGFRIETVIRRNDRVAATGTGSFTCTSSAVYRRVRGSGIDADRGILPLSAPVSPQSVGRMSPIDVVLSPIGETDRWQLRIDTRHPVLFDHPVDHMPGMVLLEAARQATAATPHRSSLMPLGVASTFSRYAELDVPCLVEAHHRPGTVPGGEESVVVTGWQDGETVFESVVTARPDEH